MYRQEHPNPQAKRANWQNLNGTWEFDFDFGKSGKERRLFEGGELTKHIEVPFCPESSLSGIGETHFLNTVWYKKTVSFDLSALIGKRVILHFGAADYKTRVWINGKSAGDEHVGGFSPFEFDITDLIVNGDNIITVCCTTIQEIPHSLSESSRKRAFPMAATTRE